MIAARTPAPMPTGTRRLSTASRELSSRSIASTCWRRGWLGCAAAWPAAARGPADRRTGLGARVGPWRPRPPWSASPPRPARPNRRTTGAGAGGPVTGAASPPAATASGAGPVPLPPAAPVSVPVTVAAAGAAGGAAAELVGEAGRELPEDLVADVGHDAATELGRLAGHLHLGEDVDLGLAAVVGHRQRGLGRRGAVAARVAALGVDDDLVVGLVTLDERALALVGHRDRAELHLHRAGEVVAVARVEGGTREARRDLLRVVQGVEHGVDVHRDGEFVLQLHSVPPVCDHDGGPPPLVRGRAGASRRADRRTVVDRGGLSPRRRGRPDR